MKLHLRIELLGESTLKMTVVSVCDEAVMLSTRDKKIYQDPYNEMVIWSFNTFNFNDKHLRLPQYNMVLSKVSHKHQFRSDKERHDTLKKFYDTLNRWAVNTSMFPNTNTTIRQRVRIRDDYWFII